MRFLVCVALALPALPSKAETGEVVWKQQLGGEFSVSPVYAAGCAYFPSASGECFVVGAGPE